MSGEMQGPKPTLQMPSQGGVRRDGTMVDSNYFSEAQWVRFLRAEGRPRKMGGYQFSTGSLSGPVTSIGLAKKQSVNNVFSFSQWGVETFTIDNNGAGGVPSAITPAGFSANAAVNWSFDVMYDSASGGNAMLLLAMPIKTMLEIDDPNNVNLYITPIGSPAVMTQVADTNAVGAGGIFVTDPYAVILGVDGNVTWSDANGPQNYGASAYPVGDAGSARVTGTKIVKGLAMRSGNATGGLLWSLDSVLRMDYVGGVDIFKFSHLSKRSSILSSSGVIEYDGVWFWAGMDRFLTCNGSQVSELPNDMNSNWFFDNLNFAQRQKVFAMKMTRWGEIWWFFPFGNATECTNAVIYNVRLKIWYDVEHSRSAGLMPQAYRYPLMTSTVANNNVHLTFTLANGVFSIGDKLQGNTSGATATVLSVSGSGPYTAICRRTSTLTFSAGETLTNLSTLLVTATVTAGTVAVGNVIKGATSLATGNVTSWVGAGPYTGSIVKSTTNGYTNGENYTDPTSGATGVITTSAALTGTLTAVRSLYNMYAHERGYDAVEENTVDAIPSYFVTCDFGMPTGGPDPNAQQGADVWTRITRVEPDFVQQGDMTLEVISREFAAEDDSPSPKVYTFEPGQGKIDTREQGREVRLKFTSNVVGGFFEGGKTIIHTEPGDVRA